MATRVIISQCFRSLALRSSVLSVPPQYSSLRLNPRKVEGTRLVFVRSYSKATEEIATDSNPEVDPKDAPIIDEKEASKMRTRVIPVEVSARYLKSNGYATTYGTEPVWVKYRRNFKGQFSQTTRKTCIRKEKLSTGNPCPICRDEYLVLDYRNVELLKQFISPYNGEILAAEKTGLCHMRQTELLVAINKAKDYGLLSFDVPLRSYDYSDYQVK